MILENSYGLTDGNDVVSSDPRINFQNGCLILIELCLLNSAINLLQLHKGGGIFFACSQEH